VPQISFARLVLHNTFPAPTWQPFIALQINTRDAAALWCEGMECETCVGEIANPAVCSKRATLQDNVDRANRKPHDRFWHEAAVRKCPLLRRLWELSGHRSASSIYEYTPLTHAPARLRLRSGALRIASDINLIDHILPWVVLLLGLSLPSLAVWLLG
jgi:hypothetical protein